MDDCWPLIFFEYFRWPGGIPGGIGEIPGDVGGFPGYDQMVGFF